MRFVVRFAALFSLIALTSFSSQQAFALSDIETTDNASTIVMQVVPRASLVVTSLNDTGPGTLREAITAANGTPEADTITFQSGLTGTIMLGSNLPQISNPLTITGPGAANLTITGPTGNNFTAFGSISNTFAINIGGLTLSTLRQGVIVVGKTLSLTDVVISSMSLRAVTTTSGSLDMTRVTVNGNIGGRAIYTTNTAVTMTDSTVRGSLADTWHIEGGTVNISSSTFTNNTGSFSGVIYANGESNPTVVNITNSTFHDNGSTNSDAIYAYYATVNISFSTFSYHNRSPVINGFGIIHAGSNSNIVLTASLIANNPPIGTPYECTQGTGATFTGSDNLALDTDCPGRIDTPTNVRATLADNGGTTQTHALLTGSNAIDAYTGAACPATDQRGLPRPAADTDCDLGAFEFGAVLPPVCPTSPATIPSGDVAALIFAIECANASPTNDVINLTDGDSGPGVDYLLTATHNSSSGDNGLPRIVSAATAGTLTINGNGATISGNDERRVLYVNGGANVTLDDLTITAGHVPTNSIFGGGIMNYGTLTMNGGGVSASSAGRGGGIMNYGTLTLNGSSFADNEALVHGGGVFNNGDMTVTGSTFSGNTAESYGGAIQGQGALTVTDSIFSGNSATDGHGGAIYSNNLLNISGSRFTDNTATYGGGVSLMGTGFTAEITDALFTTNTASVGGGVYTSMSGARTLLLMNSTIYDNTATTNGGGLFNIGTATVTNTTIANNSANRYAGIYSYGLVTVNNSTIVANIATDIRDGVYVDGGTMTLNNTILANGDEDCILNTGTVDANYTLFSNTSACGAVNGVDGNRVGADPLLGTLATAPNGTSYYPLNFASPATDAGSDALIPVGVTTDQAGNNRIRQARVDMGAFESDFVGCPAFPANIPAGDTTALIFAIECANALPANDVINLTGSTYTLTATHNTASGANGLPQIASAATAGTLTINGNGATIDGNDQRRVIYSLADADLTLNNLTISSGNIASFGGGGINNAGTLMLNDSTISGNSASYGGGIFNTGALTLTGSTVSGNTANGSGGGGGIYNSTAASTLNLIDSTVSGNTTTYFNNSNGGGIVAVGTVTLTDSTVSGNTANASGGGIFGNTTLMTLTNSTVSGNTANDSGGGFFSQGTVILNNSTVTGNTAVSSGGGFYNSGTVTLNNTILAINTPFDCVASGSSIAITMRHSLISQQHSCGVVNGVDGNIVGADPLLGTLATAPNGTQFYPLLAGSPAINSGSNALVPVGLDFDQAGNVRIQGGTVDMGAFETDTPAPAPEIAVTGNGVGIANGDTTPSLSDHTDFGTTTVGTPLTRTFTVHNTGTATLNIGTIALPAGFSLAAPIPGPFVGVGGSTALNVQCDAALVGVYFSTVSIGNNDSDENPYTFAIACQVDHAVPAGITITETAGSTAVTESGAFDIYTIVLDRVPSANVTVTLTFDGQITANGSASPVVLTFTPVNWATAQTVTVTAVNDSSVEGPHSTAISYTVASADADYNGLTLTDTAVSITDNDTASFAFSNPTGSASEGTSPYLATVVLTITSNPAGGTLGSAVSVDLNYGAGTATVGDDFVLNSSNIGFGAGTNSGASQSVDVNIVDDAISEPDETFMLLFGAVTGPATASGTHTVTILANDAPVCPAFPATIPAGDVAALIFAIECANASPSNDVINLTNSTYTLTTTHNTTNGDNGLPAIVNTATAGTLTINGNSAIISGNDERRVLYVGADADITLNTLTISGSNATIGGGIMNYGTLTLTGVTVSGNTAATGGGGIYNTSSGMLTLNNSTVSSNTATNGGGIYNNSMLTLTNSIVSGNTSTNGGGVFNYSGVAMLTNSTVSGNTATSLGGGIYANSVGDGTVILNNSTVSGNAAGISSNGDGIHNFGTLILNNTILANTGRDCVNAGGTVDANYTLFSNANACGAGDGVDGNIVGVDPLLGTLTSAPNGTSYYPLNFASPAIDAGSDALIPSGITTDQAGNNRIRQTRVDMGAFESDFVACPAFPATIPAGDVAALILAIECANALPSDDVIELTGESTYTLTATHNSLSGANGLPQIVSAATAGTLTINGNGATIDANDQRRVLYVLSGANVTLNELTVSGGQTTNNGGGIYNVGTLTLNRSTMRDNFSAGGGGGIFNQGTMTVVNSTITGNTSNGVGGGILNNTGRTLVLKNSTISQNAGVGGGGGLAAYGSVTVHNTIIAANSASGSPELDCVGTVTASHSLFRFGSCGILNGAGSNIVGSTQTATLGLTLVTPVDGSPAYYTINPAGVAVDRGNNALIPAGVTTDQPGNPRVQNITVDIGSYEVYAPPCPVSGDTIPAGDVDALIYAIECANASPEDETFELENSTYTLTETYIFETGLPRINDAAASGTLTINGNGATISGGDTARIFEVNVGGDLTLSDMTLTDGRVTGINSGGAITVPTTTSALSLDNVTITNSFAGSKGGAIYNFGQITITDSVFTGNSATDGGAIYNARTATITGSTISNNTAANGGGIYDSGSGLNITGSAVADNVSTGNGGGFYIASGSVEIRSSTISGNEAESGGAGMYLINATDVDVANSTMTDNTATFNGGAVFMQSATNVIRLVNTTIMLNSAVDGAGIFMSSGSLTTHNSILAGNNSDTGVNADCYRLAGTNNSAHSLYQNGTCGATGGVNGNIVGVNPLFGTLTTAPNGTSYYPLLAGSPAINAGDNTLVPVTMTTDQAGNTRIQGGTVDLGSYETDTPAAPDISVTGNGVTIASGDLTPDLADHTDFGTTTVGTPVTRTFTIENTGGSDLNISFANALVGFNEVGTPPASTIPAGGSTTLSVECLASAPLRFDGMINIASNDPDESAYSFSITCQVNPVTPPGITITESGGTTAVGEAGDTDTYTIALNTQPAADVTVTLTFGGQITTNGSASPVVLTFSDTTAQTVTVAAVNDSLVEGLHSATISYSVASPDAGYNGLTLTDTVVAITDNDTASFAFVNPTGSVSERTSPYLAAVVLTIVSDPPGGTLGTSVAVDFNYGPGTATPGDDFWMNTTGMGFGSGIGSGSSQWIDVIIVDDLIDEPNETFTLAFSGTTGPVTASGTHEVTIFDSNAPTEVTVTQSGGTTAVSEAGDTDTITVALSSPPTASVTVTLTFGGQIAANGSASPVTLTFTPANWSTPQTVTVAAVNDSLVEGPHSAAISYSVASADAAYNGLALSDTAVAITDNDTASFAFANPTGSVSEGTSPYLAGIVLTIVSDPPGGALGSGVSVDFNYGPGTATVGDDFAMNTSTIGFGAGIGSGASQQVDVNIVDDLIDEPDETFTLVFAATTGPVTASGTHEVTIIDNDAPVCPTSPATIPAGDVAALIFAIECANASPTDDVINLTSSTYTLTADYSPAHGLAMMASASTAGTLTINGNGATLSGNNQRSVLRVGGNTNLTLNGLTITAGRSTSPGFGGGINNDGTLTITNSTVSGNRADLGGGINNSGTLTITDSTVSGNTADLNGGGIIHIGSTLTITNSTVSGNTAIFGGGIYQNSGTLTITNSTVSGNTAVFGGGISQNSGTLTITNNTISNNTATSGGGIYQNSGTLTITNSIFAGGLDCQINSDTVAASYTLFANSVACGAVSGVNGNLVGVDPLLGALATAPNGTAYYPLLEGSPAINSGSNALVPVGLTLDQAGNARIQGGTVDMGAFETNTPAPAVVVTETDGTTSVSEAGGTDTYTVALTAAPSANVTVTLTFNSQITVNGSASPLALTFSDTTPQTVTVAAVNDSLVEGAHTSAISYAVASAAAGYNGFSIADTTVSITDNDTATASFSTPDGSISEAATPYTANVVLTVVSDPAGGSLGGPASLTVYQAGGTAVEPDDYTLVSGIVNFNPGAVSGATVPLTFNIVDDTIDESDETIVVAFGGPTGPYLIGSGTHTITIVDNDIAGNLLKNPGFETAGTGITKAANWSSAILTKKDKRVCDKPTKTFAYSGNCAFRFQQGGILTASRVVKQTVTNPAVGIKGESYTLDAMISATNLAPGAKLILQVKYGNGTKAKAVINVPSGTYDYTAVETALPITRKVKWVRVKLVGGTAAGRLLIDDLVLWVEPGTSATDTRSSDALLPPPPAPDGFRSAGMMP